MRAAMLEEALRFVRQGVFEILSEAEISAEKSEIGQGELSVGQAMTVAEDVVSVVRLITRQLQGQRPYSPANQRFLFFSCYRFSWL
jgi:hypothetical protein